MVSNTYRIQKKSQEINVWERVSEDFLYCGLKALSVASYKRALRKFCSFAEVDNPYDLVKLEATKERTLDRIERLMVRFIRTHDQRTAQNAEDILSPKYLNIVYCSVKRWCTIKELIKSARIENFKSGSGRE